VILRAGNGLSGLVGGDGSVYHRHLAPTL